VAVGLFWAWLCCACSSKGAALFFLQSQADDELNSITQQNAKTQASIAALKKKTAEVAQLESEKALLQQQKGVLDTLIEGQSGPVNMLFELSEMLRPEDDPQRKLEQQNRGWNPDWDPKRLWIDGFIEKMRRLKVNGFARTNDDLAEFLHRLNTSKHFVNVRLNVSETVEAGQVEGLKLVRFDLDALSIYGPADVKRLADGLIGDAPKRK
jgi:type IV pilus assembly protein PilN